MKFGQLPLADALGHTLGHNVFDATGRRRLRKGRKLAQRDLELLEELERTHVYVAQLESGDLDEDSAAAQITRSAVAPILHCSRATTGRVNVHAPALGVVRVDAALTQRINLHTGVTLATLRHNTVAREGRIVGTTKILPYALPAKVVDDCVAAIEESAAHALDFIELTPRSVGLILSGSTGGAERMAGFADALRARLEDLGSTLDQAVYVDTGASTGEAELASCIDRMSSRSDLVILAGETAIQDRHDLAPSAVEAAGGTVQVYGAPVDPGNLAMLGDIRGVPVLGAPGCARSPKRNIVDLLLPRLLIGDRLDASDVASLGHGGLLEDVPERPLPRRKIDL